MARRPADLSNANVSELATGPRTPDAVKSFKSTSLQDLFWDLITFDRLMTGPVVHLIYWAGLAILLIGSCGIIGGGVGMAISEGSIKSVLLAIPIFVTGIVFLLGGALIWRSICEFYVAVFRISDDLRTLLSEIDRRSLVQPQQGPAATAARRRAEPEAKAPEEARSL